MHGMLSLAVLTAVDHFTAPLAFNHVCLHSSTTTWVERCQSLTQTLPALQLLCHGSMAEHGLCNKGA